MRINLSNFCWKNADTIDGFKRNWWSDKHEYHLESCYCSVHHRWQLHVRWCDKMWKEAKKPENIGVWKVGESLAPFLLLLIARRTGKRCKLPSGVEFAGLKTKKITNFVTPWIAFLWGKLAAFWTTSLTAFRWGSHEDSEQRKRQFSIKLVLVQNTCWLSYTMQRCLLIAALRENFTHVHSQIQDDAWEALKLPLRGNSGGIYVELAGLPTPLTSHPLPSSPSTFPSYELYCWILRSYPAP